MCGLIDLVLFTYVHVYALLLYKLLLTIYTQPNEDFKKKNNQFTSHITGFTLCRHSRPDGWGFPVSGLNSKVMVKIRVRHSVCEVTVGGKVRFMHSFCEV